MSPPIDSERTPLLSQGVSSTSKQYTSHSETPDYADVERNGDASGSADDGHVDDSCKDEEPSAARLLIVLGSTWIGVFMASIDSSIMATLSGPISSSFNSFQLFSWLVTSYMIANAAIQPLSGKLTDIFSRRTGLVVANIVFGAGNLICGLAKTDGVMILGRVIAGLGGGCLHTISTFLASDLVPLRYRGLWQGFGNIAFAVGYGVGGVFGGFMSDLLGWRWAFLVQIPLTAVSTILVFFTVPPNLPWIEEEASTKSRLKRIDFLGSITLIVSLVLMLLGVSSGGNIVPWNHPLVYVSLPLSAMFLALFVYVEDKVAQEPIIPVRMLLRRTIAVSCLVNWFSSMGYFIVLFYGPLFFQMLGFSASAAGLRLTPSAIGVFFASLVAGYVMRATGRYYILNVISQSLLVLGAALFLGLLNPGVPAWPPFLMFFINGAGYGSMLTITLLSLIAAADHKFHSVITSASYAFRSTGSTIGLTIAGAVFQNIVGRGLEEAFSDRKDADDLIGRLRGSIEELQLLAPDLKSKALDVYMAAFKGAWGACLGCLVVSAVVSLFMREHTLHSNLSRK